MKYVIVVLIAFSIAAVTLIWLQEYQKQKLLEIIEMPTRKTR